MHHLGGQRCLQVASFEYGKGRPFSWVTEMFPIVEVSPVLSTICLLFLCILNVKTAELFEYYKEKLEMHTAHTPFKNQWFEVQVPINCLSEKAVSEWYIVVFEDWIHHKKRIATNFRRRLNITLPNSFLSSVDSRFPISKNYEKNNNDALIGKLF